MLHVVSRPSRFDHGALKRGCRSRREPSVNAAYIVRNLGVIPSYLVDVFKISKEAPRVG